jgi:hypothetical protein
MLQQLKKIVLTQRSLFNSKSLADRIPKILLDVLIGTRKDKMADTGSSRMGRGSGENMTLVTSKTKSTASSNKIGRTEDTSQTDSFKVTNKGNRFEIDKLFLVRINPDLLKLMRRIQRFAQVSAARCMIRDLCICVPGIMR